MGKIHCKTCTCEASSRPRTGEFSCPNCFRPNNSEGWLRYHLKNQCEVSPAREREELPTHSKVNRTWARGVKEGWIKPDHITAEEYIAKYGRPKKTNMRMDPTRW
jgi:uncharacterized Zn finger protein (UPF0148 family)